MRSGTKYQARLMMLTCALAVLTGIAWATAADDETDATRILKRLLGAVEASDYDSFVADGCHSTCLCTGIEQRL
jgi:hypothetical protein